MKIKSYEFDTKDKHCFIRNINLYTGLSYEKCYNKQDYVLHLYYFKRYTEYEDCITCERDYDYFYFKNKEELLKVYNEVKKLLEEE